MNLFRISHFDLYYLYSNSNDYTKDLDEEVRTLRNDDGRERDYMTYMQTIMEHEDMAYNRGISQANKAMAIKMLKANKPYEEISEFTELTMSEIDELAASLHMYIKKV